MSKTWLVRFAILALGMAFGVGLAGASTIRVDDGFQAVGLAPYLDLLEDPSGKVEFDAVAGNGAFAPLGDRNPNFGFSKSAWWVRFAIENQSDSEYVVNLRQDYPLIDTLDVWMSNDAGGFDRTATGDRRPFATRTVAHRDFVFPVTIPARGSRTVYARFETAGAMNIGLSLHGQQTLLESFSREQLAYGFYYGGFGVLVIYNLFIFLVVRDRAFFYYLLYAISYGLYFAVHNGLAFQFLWPDHPDWANQSLIVLLCLSLVFGLQFTRRFLNTAAQAPRLDKLATVLLVGCLLGLLASFVLPYATVIIPVALLTVVTTILMLTLGVVCLLQGYRPAVYFMLAWVSLLIGVLAYMLKTFGILPHNALTQNGFQVGALIEMVLLSLALAARVNELQRQSLTDPLTKLANRRYFDRQLELAFAHSDRGSVVLLVVDIDHFKQFNDRYGHAVGDTVLTTVGQVLSKTIPRGATVCRYGGEEFTVILPAMDPAKALGVAESLRRAVEATQVGDAAVTISVGLASAADRPFANEYEFFRAADSALYKAKQKGRNRVERYVVAESDGVAALAQSA